MSPNSNLLMVGLKGSGKTSYLAALWHYLESAEIEDQISVPQLQPDRDYLNSVRNSWLSLKALERTSLRTRDTASLRLQDKKSGALIDLTIPDLSGESYRLQWFTRKAPLSYVQFAQKCNGAFLFLHPGDFKRTHAIKASSVDEVSPEDQGKTVAIPISENWTPEQTSTQVQLVDILQLLLSLRDETSGMRLAVVISAWDLVSKHIAPITWLESRLPLLSQFLRANSDWMVSEVFGVSSQGGDLIDDRKRLLDSPTASARCYAVRGTDTEAVSVTAPLQFLLNF